MGKIIKAAVIIVASVAAAVVLGPQAGLLIAAIGFSAVSKTLAKKPAAAGAGLTSKISLDPNASQVIAVGRPALVTQLIYFGTSGSTNQNLSMIFAHSGMPIDGFVSLTVNNVATSWPTPSGAYAGILAIETATGSHSANPFTTVHGGGWTSAHIGRGLAMSHFRWTYDATKLASGLPQTIQWVAGGRPVYDPRRDSTRGGSGSMRADNRATWAYSVSGTDIGRNPSLIDLSYRLGWTENGRLKAGMGEDPANLDFASYGAMASVCEEVVAGKPRYLCDLLLDIGPNTPHNDNLARIHATCGGRPVDTGGLTGIWVAHDDLAVVALTLGDDDFMGPLDWQPLPEGQLRNTARGSFVSPADLYQPKDYAEVAPSDLRALDNGVELAEPLNFEGIGDADQARRVANIRIRESRQGVLRAPSAMRAFGLKPMQVAAVNHPRWGWSGRKFRVEAMQLAPTRVELVLRAVAAADYADLAAGSVSTPAALPTLGYIPVLGVLALANTADWATQVTGAAKPEDNADVTATSQIVVTLPPEQVYAANYLGTLTEPLTAASVKVARGATSIKGDAATSYSIATSGTVTATIDNTPGSATKGDIVPTAFTGNTGWIDVTVTVAGVARPVQRLVFTKQLSAAPSGGGTGGGGATGKIATDAALLALTATSYVAISRRMTVTLASGESLYGTGSIDYYPGGTTAAVRSVTFKWRCAVAGSGSFTDFAGSTVAGSNSASGFYLAGEWTDPSPGHADVTQTKGGLAAGDYDVELWAQINAGGRTIYFDGIARVEAMV